jgi:hypothetical protein
MIFESLTPLIYLIAVAFIGAGLHYAGVPPELTGMIVGAGITRIRKSPSKNGEK